MSNDTKDARKKQFAIIAGRIKLIGSRRKTPEVKALWLEAAALIAKAGGK